MILEFTQIKPNQPKFKVFCNVFLANPNKELNVLVDCCCWAVLFCAAFEVSFLYPPSLIFKRSKILF